MTSQVVSGSTDKTIRQWNIDSAPAIEMAVGHSEAVSLLSISANGSRIISGTTAGSLIVWDAAALDHQDVKVAIDGYSITSRAIGSFDGHTDRIQLLQLTADGALAVTGARDRTLRMWDLKRAVCKQVFRGHLGEILDLDISTDGKRMVSFSADRTSRVWDSETGQNIRALVSEDNERALSSLRVKDAMLVELEIGPKLDIVKKRIPRNAHIAISPDGNLAVVGYQGNVCAWNLLTGSTRNLEYADFDIVSIAFDANSEKVVLGSLFGQLLVWDFEHEPSILTEHSNRVLDTIITPNGKCLISAAKDDTIHMWDVDSLTLTNQIVGPSGRVDAVALAPNGNYAYSIYGDTLVAYDLVSSTRFASLSFDHQISTIAVTPSGERVAIGDRSGRVHYLCLQT